MAFNAGSRVQASNLKQPFVVSAGASSNLTATTTVTDIAGATVTFSTVTAAATVLIWGVFDITTTSAANTTAVGHCSVDGTDQTTQALHQLITLNCRETVAQVWTATLSGSGAHTIKLRGVLSGAGGATFGTPHTTVTVQVFDF